MKLLRYMDAGRLKPGLLDEEDRIHDLSFEFQDISGEVLSPEKLEFLKGLTADELPLVDGNPKLGPPIADIGKIVGVGLNYKDHVTELGLEAPKEPVLFMKATSALAGPNDDISLPKGGDHVDWEVELAVVIGTTAQNVSREAALDHVAGYSVICDLSERSWQNERGGQWTKGKSAVGFAPLGPWLVTADEAGDPQEQGLWLAVDGRRKQFGNTEQMVFGVAELVSYISEFMRLDPGDVIATGTPPGVGHCMSPPEYLRAGNRLTLGIDGMGEQSHHILGAG